jgi:arginine decarboxylase
MKFNFPVVIIDEDFKSENSSGLGIRVLAKAIEEENFEVLGVTSYGDLTSFAQQQSQHLHLFYLLMMKNLSKKIKLRYSN